MVFHPLYENVLSQKVSDIVNELSDTMIIIIYVLLHRLKLTALNMTDMAARRFSSLSSGESASCILRKCFEITAKTAEDGTFVDS